MGVSGFLISCAMRRATSPQAAMRCADIRSVTSSKVTTAPALEAALMRTSRMRRVPRCRISTWPWVTRSGRSAACATSGASSGITSVSGRPSTPSSGSARSSSAERLLRVIVPASSTLSTPAETPARTASVSRRRVSSSVLASTSSPRCCSIWLAMRLNERASWPSSSSGGPS